jgi:hypothetical protein
MRPSRGRAGVVAQHRASGKNGPALAHGETSAPPKIGMPKLDHISMRDKARTIK